MSTYPFLSVVVPVYNEDASLVSVVERLAEVPYLGEIVIIDDCSTDETPQRIDELKARYGSLIKALRHERNQGKTAALRTGFALTTGEIVIVQDADLEYDPTEIKDVIGPIIEGRADVVYGSRFMVKRAARVLYFYHFVANKILTFTSNLFTNLNMTDVETGYKAFRGEIIRNMVITSRGFGFEIEVTAKVAKLRCRVYEVPISYYGRTYEEGKKIGTWDGLEAFWFILKYNVLTSKASSFSEVPEIRPLKIPDEVVVG